MRLFAGLAVAADVRERLASALAPLHPRVAGLRWSAPHGWHLTLAFLGDVDPHRLGDVRAVAARAAARAPAVELRIGAAGRFGPRVLWVGVDGDPPDATGALGEDLQAALAGAGLPVQQRPVAPHLTVARAGRRAVDDRCVRLVDEVLAATDARSMAWSVTALTVWRSHLGDGPARYEVVGEAPLAG